MSASTGFRRLSEDHQRGRRVRVDASAGWLLKLQPASKREILTRRRKDDSPICATMASLPSVTCLEVRKTFDGASAEDGQRYSARGCGLR